MVTRNGVPETPAVEDTIGSDADDWLTTTVAGITLDGARGDDVIVSYREDVTLIGGEGNDTIEAYANDTTINAGSGDDSVRAIFGTTGTIVDLGSGDDDANITDGTVIGGDGADVIYGRGYSSGAGEERTVVVFGDEGDDLLSIIGSGPDDQAFGGQRNDTVSAYRGGIADGGAGDDLVQVDTGAQAFGGDGDDFISVYNGVSEDGGPATLTGGAGQDTFEASILNFGGEDEGVFAVVTDFDPDNDMLVVNHRDGNAEFTDLENVTLIPAEDGSFTDVQLEYTSIRDGDRGTAIVRLDGVTDLTLAQISILT